jgi:hypothetical protein
VTRYPTPLEQQYGARLAEMQRRLAVLQSQVAHLTSGPVAVTSTTHPASPNPGTQILETDTGLTAQWNGSAWVYGRQLIAKQLLSSSQASITFTVPTGPAFSTLRVAWSARSDNASPATYMCVQFNGDTSSHYLFQINQVNNATPDPGNSGGTTNLIEVGTMAAATATSGYIGSGEFMIPNASGATFKQVSGYSSSMNSTTNGYAGVYGGTWLASTQITSITLFPFAGNLIAGSAAYLYGET